VLSFRNALRDLHVENPIAKPDVASVIDLGDAQRDGARRTCESIAQIDQDPGVVVFATCTEPGRASEWALAATHSAEQGFKEVAELTAFEIRAGELEAGIPVGRRPELLARLPFLAELIVGGTLLRVAENP
jgi:hypothetical protein